MPASLYSPDSFQTPNGYALPYYGPRGRGRRADRSARRSLSPARPSRANLREIETHLKPDYRPSNDIVELQLHFELTHDLTWPRRPGTTAT